jgi:uncharacterized repeat protein (TIGR01451 family)
MSFIGRRTRRIGTIAALAGAFAGLVGGLFTAAPAFADPFTAVLQITKTVNKANLVANDTLVYTIAVDCSTDNCVAAQLTDTLPPEFDALTLNTTPAVSGGPSTFSWGGTNNRTLTVNFTKATPGGAGIPAGTGYSVQVSLTVPSSLPADWPSNGHAVTNTASVAATTAAPVSASADATITVPYSVNTAVGATWTPNSAQFKVADPSTLNLTIQNTSNASATSLTLLAPTDPTAASSFFEYVNLTGFGPLVFPAGADRVQVDAYVSGAWIDGPVGANADLDPSITDLSLVRGLRITFTSSTGSTISANGSAGSLTLKLGQRASTRTGGTSLITGASVTANVTGSILVPTQPVKSVTASAAYAITGLTSVVSAATSFTGNRIAAGTSSIATLTGKNLSNGPLTTLTVTQPTSSALFGPKVTFGGFSTTGLAWPSGATGATVTWFVDGGTVPAPTPVAALASMPATPAVDPGQKVIGFAVEFAGAIAANATAAVPFTVNVAEDAVPAVPGTLTLTNSIRVDGVNDAGAATPKTATANLVVLYPQIGLTMTKTVTPSASVPVPPGGRSIVQLKATTSSDSGFVTPTNITIVDQASGAADDYWNAFNVVGVAPTQVLANSTLLVQYTLDGSTWIDLGGVTAGATAATYQQVFPPADAPNIIGVRFVHTKAAGFAQSSALVGNLSFQSRATIRGSATPTSSSTTTGTSYTNATSAVGTGTIHVPGGGSVTGSANATAPGAIVSLPGGSGGEIMDKAWTTPTVDSQSGQTKVSRLKWGTALDGYATAVVQDPASEAAPVASTVFQAFNLTRVEAITTTTDPLIAFDQVSDIELYAAGVWTSVKATACATPANCQGKFNGFTLNATQQANTTAVRITFAEWAAGRTASTNPLTPPVGSGVASSPSSRQLDLTFQIRNQLRDASATPANPWVTGARVYNATDPGAVSNTAKVTLGSHTATDADTIVILDRPPAVATTKVAQNSAGATLTGPIAIPSPNDTTPAAYPVVKFSMLATNASTARAWYLRVTDQMPCTTGSVSTCAHLTTGGVSGSTVNPYDGHSWDPSTSPFEYFTIEKVTVTPTTGSGISVPLSTITFWKADGTNETVPLTDPKLTNAAYLANVVGASVLLSSTSVTGGGTIVSGGGATVLFDTRLRKFTRSDNTLIAGPHSITNSVFAQDWDGVLDDTAAFGSASAVVNLTDAKIDVAVTKNFSVSGLLEANRTNDVTVTLHADQATATASLNKLIVSDTDAAFWNNFELRSLTSNTMPLGSDRVHVEVQTNGDPTWIAGATVASSPALPGGVTTSQITGLRYVFERADGGLFSVTAPSAAWSTDILFTVRLRSALRDTGASIPFPGSVSNTASGTVLHPDLGTKSATATRALTLDPGTFRVDVEKQRPVATSPAGETLNFKLIFKNTGTGYLDNPVIVDQLPIDATLSAGGPLLFDPTSETTYSTTAGGILPVTGVGVAYNDTTRRITFTWPSGSRLAPGETYTILVPLQLAPGLQAVYGDAINRFTFTSDRTLSACTNTSGNGEGVSQPGGTKFCSTTSRVQAVSASAISSFKGVKGDVDALGNSTRGAVNINDANTACVADSQGFYRNPCAANTVVGGTDLWKVQFTNGGNVPAVTSTIVDVLPKSGDVYLGTGASRGSTFRPVFAGGVVLTATGLATGATLASWQVTTTANPCPSYAANPTCSAATWLTGSSFPVGNYGQITAVRFTMDYSAVVASPGTLPPAAVVTINYKTVNTPTTSPGDGRAPVTAPMINQRAWNTFGIYATFPSGYTDRRVEPVRAGVQLSAGPLQVAKAITGTGAAWAPTAFAATASCVVAGVPVVLPSAGSLNLAATNGVPYTSRIDGIPLGSVCDIVENTTGASSISYSPANGGGTAAQVTIATAGSSASSVPLGQSATITNDYGTTSLTVHKQVSTTATVGTFGPFAFSLSCTVDNGTAILPVPLAAADSTFTLADGGSHTVTELPVTARCALAETGSDGATTIGIAVDGGSRTTVAQSQAYTVTLGTNPGYTADVLNTYAGGQLAVTKTVIGSGAGFGTGPFTVHVLCTYDSQTLFDGDFTILDGGTHQLSEIFPIGTLCAISETDAGGATSPASGSSVTIPAPTGAQTVGLVTAGLTNRFDTGSLKIVKARVGSAARYGAGPFEAQVLCTWDKPGSADLAIPLPNGGLVSLDSGNGYTATVTGLIGGADCTVTETQTGGATSTSISVIAPAAIPVNGTSTVTITNDYATGNLVIDKVRTGPGKDAFGAGPFTVAVACTYLSNGASLPIDLGADATQVLDAGNSYHAVITDLLIGAHCVVTETDPGLATSTTYTPGPGDATIVAMGGTDARVVVTNDFQVGHLDVEKTPSVSIVQGGESYDYTFVVKNVGDVDAAGVKLVDVLDPTLKATGIDSTGWVSCDVTGEDVDGFGGTLTCELNDAAYPVLPIGATAPTITLTVEVLDTISKDQIPNDVDVTSTTIVVSGDHDSVTTPVKWLSVIAAPQCVKDAPWLAYTVDAHNLDVAGHTLTIDWKDATGAIIHTDSIPVTASGIIHGDLLWPGAEVDADGNGIAWPGWRAAGPGETPQWENLILDPAAYGYGLRSGATIDIHINPSTTVSVTYPPATVACGEAPAGRDTHMWLTKTASRGYIEPGGKFDYTIKAGNEGPGSAENVTLVDDVPGELQVLRITPAVPTDPKAPAWAGCAVVNKDADGYGGQVNCALDRPLAAGETVPDVVLGVKLNPKTTSGTIVNVVTLTAQESPSDPAGRARGLVSFRLQANAVVVTGGTALALTGGATLGVQLALGLLAAGVLLIVIRRRRRTA